MLRFYCVPISVFFFSCFGLLPNHQVGSFTYLIIPQSKMVVILPLNCSFVLQSAEVVLLVRFCLFICFPYPIQLAIYFNFFKLPGDYAL